MNCLKAGRKTETYNAMRNLEFAILFKLKQIVSNNSIYKFEDEELLNF